MSGKLARVTRFEVVDETGRVYVRDPRGTGPVKVTLSYQDEGRTLMVFVEARDPAFARLRKTVRAALADPKVKALLTSQRKAFAKKPANAVTPWTTWAKRDDKAGKFMDVKVKAKPFKGVRKGK